MNSYIRIITFAVVALISIYYYYFVYSHGEQHSGMITYLIVVGLIYGIYKLLQTSFEVKQVSISMSNIIMIFLGHILLLCLFYFGFTGESPFLGAVLFLKIFFFLSLTSFLWLFIYSVGYTVLTYSSLFKEHKNKAFVFLSSLGLGFFIFSLGVFLLAVGGLYEKIHLVLWVIILAGIGYKQSLIALKSIKLPAFFYNLKDSGDSFKLFVDEIHFLIISLLLSVNFISVYRPFPIGWDDLGVYMNYPKLLAQAGELIPLGQMQTWQLYTGIGHVFGNQTYAFFLNSFSGILAAIVTYIALSGILGKQKQKFNIPLLGVMILLMMPMTVFQLAKDMKLDYALLTFSIIPLYMIYQLISTEEKKSHKKSFLPLGLIGLLIGLAFSVKITSLLLFLGIVGLLFYKKFSLWGYIGYLGIFLGAFSYLGLWGMMNVVFPQENQLFVNTFSLISVIFGLGGLFIGYKRSGKKIKSLHKISQEVGLIFLGFLIALLPWVIFHIVHIPEGTHIQATTLISGVGENYKPNFNLIYSDQEIIEKKSTFQRQVSDSGVTTNEDFGRYFGYEKGINNYLKLPWNLTFQVNQKGEFTDITYIFFALIPGLLLFLPYRKEKYVYGVIAATGLTLLYYIPSPISSIISSYFSHITLPGGYIYIFLFALSPLLYLYHTLDRTQKVSQIFLTTLVFLTTYMFLWSISSFGVVWYGVVMYFSFLVLILLSLVSVYTHHKKVSSIVTYGVLTVVWIYVLSSAIPHAVSNLKTPGYIEYKLGKQSQEETLMYTHPDYFPILYTLNLSPESQAEMFIEYRNGLLEIVDDMPESESLVAYIQGIKEIKGIQMILGQLGRQKLGEQEEDIRNLEQKLFEEIMYVAPEKKNVHNIYRIGTFLKYFISENNKRLLEDSLITTFSTYFYDEDFDTVVDRFKSLDIKYLLIDLNAATIDQDPRKQLTKRYEDLLMFATHPDVQLVETDSVCVKLALDEYNRDKDIEKYLQIAGINYGNGQEKGKKKMLCLSQIYELIKNEKINKENYSYLLRIQEYLFQTLKNAQDTGQEIDSTLTTQTLNRVVNHGYKALFEIK